MSFMQDIYYQRLSKLLLSGDNLQKFGFPYINDETGTVNIDHCSFFTNPDIEKQVCRCKKILSLLDENWFLEGDKICQYHPMKCKRGIYQCCGRQAETAGCKFSSVHTSSYFSLEGDWFKFKPSTYEKQHTINTVNNIFALDCEFVYTTLGMEVARVSLVSMDVGVVYDEFVKPYNRVLDFNTRFSGIRKEHLCGRYVKSLHDVQTELLDILNSDSILIGHSLHSDLISLHFIHDKVIDTSVLYPHLKGFPYRNSLQYLADKYLNFSIHEEVTGHDSVEDAEVCIQLVMQQSKLSTNRSRRTFNRSQIYYLN